MGFETNRHVERLNQYLPFDPGHAQIYEESTDPSDSPKLEPKALASLIALVQQPASRLVVLTGDAGHGKTHLCRRLVECTGLAPQAALSLLKAHPTGDHTFAALGDRSIRIVKDLSEIDKITAAELLERAVSPTSGAAETFVVCANEGRLRDVVSGRPELRVVREALERSVTHGTTTVDGAVHVVNLNFQSVTAPGGSLLQSLLRDWVQDERRWIVCRRCAAASKCPILANRRELSDGGGASTDEAVALRRREGLDTLLRLVEESGRVVTIRELLILVAYLVTGGLSCGEVADRASLDSGWQSQFAFHELLFDPPLKPDQRRSLPVLATLHRLDPGQRAIRSVDEPLAAGAVPVRATFVPRLETTSDVSVRTRKTAKEEAERTRRHMRFLRRRDYFDLETSGREDGSRSRATRLGFRHYSAFDFLRNSGDPGADPRTFVAARDELLAGLHAVQGVHYTGGGVRFYVIDPAFSRGSSTASVIARQLDGAAAVIEAESRAWASSATRENHAGPTLPAALDWLDRRLIVSFEGERCLELDLLQFEYVMRSAQGLGCRRFFRADIRRIITNLSTLVRREEDRAIRVLVGSRLQNVTIDHGGLIRTAEG